MMFEENTVILYVEKTAVASEKSGNTVTKRKRISSKSALGATSYRSEEEQEAEECIIKNCISKAIQYYQTNDLVLGNHNNLNSLGMRNIPDPKSYTVDHVKDVTKAYFKTLAYGPDGETGETNSVYDEMAFQAYRNTYHVANVFLGVYCKSKYGVNGSCWSDYKKNDEQSMMVYMLERIVFYWNNNSSNPGVPSGSGRMSDLAAANPFLPLYLAKNSWIARGMIISLMGNAKKIVRNINGHKRGMLLTAIFHQRPNPVASMASSGSMSGPMAALNMNTTPRSIVSNTHLEHDFRPVYLEGVPDEQDQPAPSRNESFSVPGTDPVQYRRPSPSPSSRLSASVCLSPASSPPPPKSSTSSPKD
ncbi:hypothetical protein INT47_005071 [Mucor saturninus]|uniref:Uncharacterized protein n=1 Tax=Mucor saturninus TaxID=64648 RepID=A0A8H7QHF1_9FUNG|nr:hypothetical protein INT47_005071 [Mucor saturninus]